MSCIWHVHPPDDDTTLTVIAASADDAIQLAADCLAMDDGDNFGWDVAMAASDGYRWVCCESADDAAQQVRDLESAGVTIDRILTRTTEQPGIGPVLWEVGARDDNWCRLPACVLCGGEE